MLPLKNLQMAEKEPEKMMKTMKIPEPVAKEKAENKRRTI
jgi:hypothetical protein